MGILTSLILMTCAWADKVSYPAQSFSAAGIDSIRVVGVKGSLRLVGRSAKSYQIHVKHSKAKRFEDWSLSIDRQGDTLVLEVFNVAYGAQWRTQVREELWPEFDVELSGPAQSAVLSWREGSVDIQGWNAEVEASFLKGRFHSEKMQGALKLQAVDAQIQVTKHNGSVQIKGERGRVDLEDIKGDIHLNWVSGVIRGQNLDSIGEIESTDADVKIDNSRGQWKLQLTQGHARLSDIGGIWKASGVRSEWHLALKAPGDVEIVSESGPVRIDWRKGGAKLFLSSKTGDIRVPKPWQVEIRNGLKVVEAEREKPPKGQVFVRTQSGLIEWL
jgi:hypothetical protein